MGKVIEKTIRELQRSKPKPGATGGRSKVVYDREVPGFGLRISSGGTIAFILSYWIHGRKRRIAIGRYPELTPTMARDRALKLRGMVLDGTDPLEQRHLSQQEPTINELANKYLNDYAAVHKRERSVDNDKRKIEGIIRPRLGRFRVRAVTRRDIETLHSSLKATPVHANRVLSLLSKMMNLAVLWGWRPDNPVKGVPRFREEPRQRWLTAEELSRLTKALDKYQDQNVANAFRLLLLTGAREGEVLNASWSQFDLQRGFWHKPSSHTKQKREHHLPLSDSALKLLKKMNPKGVARGYLFPGTNGGPRVTLQKPWLRICKVAGLVEEYEKKGKRRTLKRYRTTLRIHDLRHSYASHLVSSGVSLHVVGGLLGHARSETTQRYSHLASEALRDAANRFGKILQAATERKR